MSNPRRRLLSAMIRGYFGSGPVPHDSLDVVRPGLLAALDEVEPLIRADERERVAQAIEAAAERQQDDGFLYLRRAARIARSGGRDE